MSALSSSQQAQIKIESLIASLATDNPNYVIAQLQSIITQLEKVELGTTVYSQAQELITSAQKKLKEISG